MTPTANVKQVIVMRTDLNMRKGKMIAQGAHAAMKFLVNYLTSDEGNLTDEQTAWMQGSFTKICVGVGSDDELQAVIDAAAAEGVPVEEIIDSGRTEFGGIPTRTCCAVGPDYSDKIDKVTGSLKLL